MARLSALALAAGLALLALSAAGPAAALRTGGLLDAPAAGAADVSGSKQCKTVKTVAEHRGADFDLKEYVRAPWYVQEQQPTPYQPESLLYCVAARYTILSPSGDMPTLDVFNYANANHVNGPVRGGHLRAVIPNTDVESRLKVGPKFLPVATYGDYFIVAIGREGAPSEGVAGAVGASAASGDDERYSWVVVSGGQPTVMSDEERGLCKFSPGSHWFSGGLWIMTREKNASENIIKKAREAAVEAGFDPSVLTAVHQKGCKYDEFPTEPTEAAASAGTLWPSTSV